MSYAASSTDDPLNPAVRCSEIDASPEQRMTISAIGCFGRHRRASQQFEGSFLLPASHPVGALDKFTD
jgi:hypothetical protein